MHPSHTKIEPTVLIGPLCSDLYQKKCGLIRGELAVDVFTYWRASVLGLGVRRIACLIYWSIFAVSWTVHSDYNTQRIMTQTHTHMFKVTLIGWGRLTWKSHYTGLSGVDCGVTDILLKCLMWP